MKLYENNSYYYKIKDPEIQQKILNQWKILSRDKKGKTFLKRFNSISDVTYNPYLNQFKRVLPPYTSHIAIGSICGLLSIINEKGKGSLGKKMACKKGDKPTCSEEKLRILLKSNNWDELYTNLRRILIQIKGDVNPLSIVDFILHWEDEKRYTRDFRNLSLKFKVYKSYYTHT